MVYDWDQYEAECYQQYVEERKPLDEVMQHMKEVHNFNPSKRAFQTQFRRWDFPSKQNPAHKNASLVDRVHQLWGANTSQKDMLRILNAEGHQIKERELMRVRAKNRWLLRVPNGTKTQGVTTPGKQAKGMKRKREDESPGDMHMEHILNPIDQATLEQAANQVQHSMDMEQEDDQEMEDMDPDMSTEGLSPQVLEKRKARLDKLAAESDARWATKKRRRRTRGWAGLPADPPGPPRFPSETTIDESKAYLHLDNKLYRQVRDQFQSICEDAGFHKKTVAGPEKWQAAKDRLVQENAHLNNEYYGPPNDITPENKALALDVICTDVTKRMRTLERRMTIAEAKTILHVNPEQSREIRNQFYEVLKNDHFTSKLEAGDQHWAQLKQHWIDSSLLLQQVLSPENGDESEHADKLKAIEVLCRDVMKRLRDDQTKRDPSRKKQINAGPGPGPAPPKITKPPTAEAAIFPSFPPYAPTAPMLSAAERAKRGSGHDDEHDELQIDPSLLAAASDPTLDITLQLQQFAAEAAGRQEYDAAQSGAAADVDTIDYSPVPVFFRIHESSPLQAEPKFWIGMLPTAPGAASITQMVQIVQVQHPSAVIMKFWGVLRDEQGRETMYALEREEDLGIYLQFTFTEQAKPTFLVQIADTQGGL